MKKLLLSLFLGTAAFAGLPPTTSKGIGDSSDITTFKYQFPYFAITHTGTVMSLGVLSPAGGGTGAAGFAANSVPYSDGTTLIEQNPGFIFDGTILELGAGHSFSIDGGTMQLSADTLRIQDSYFHDTGSNLIITPNGNYIDIGASQVDVASLHALPNTKVTSDFIEMGSSGGLPIVHIDANGGESYFDQYQESGFNGTGGAFSDVNLVRTTLGIGQSSPVYNVDIQDTNGSGVDIGNSNSGNWRIDSSSGNFHTNGIVYAGSSLQTGAIGNGGFPVWFLDEVMMRGFRFDMNDGAGSGGGDIYMDQGSINNAAGVSFVNGTSFLDNVGFIGVYNGGLHDQSGAWALNPDGSASFASGTAGVDTSGFFYGNGINFPSGSTIFEYSGNILIQPNAGNIVLQGANLINAAALTFSTGGQIIDSGTGGLNFSGVVNHEGFQVNMNDGSGSGGGILALDGGEIDLGAGSTLISDGAGGLNFNGDVAAVDSTSVFNGRGYRLVTGGEMHDDAAGGEDFQGGLANIDSAGNITATSFTGSGSGLTNLPAASITGVLPLANGGTNNNLTAANGAIPYSDASKIVLLAAGSSGQVLQSNGAGAPSWVTPAAVTPTLFGTRSSARSIVAATGITSGASHMSTTAGNQKIYVVGSITGNSLAATISAGTIDGQVMCIQGTSNTATVDIDDGTTTNVVTQGAAILGASDIWCASWDAVNWNETNRSIK